MSHKAARALLLKLTRAASRASFIFTLSRVTKSALRVIAARRLPLARYSVTRAGGRRALRAASLRCLRAGTSQSEVMVTAQEK